MDVVLFVDDGEKKNLLATSTNSIEVMASLALKCRVRVGTLVLCAGAGAITITVIVSSWEGRSSRRSEEEGDGENCFQLHCEFCFSVEVW